MEFRIADTFLGSLARLAGDEQKAVKTTAFDLQMDATSPGLQFHKLDRAKDRNFWSVRVGRDIRLIVHKTQNSMLLCYVDHHDKAYSWAERRKLETHPKTGAAQIVEIRETVQEIFVPQYREAGGPAKRRPFAGLSDYELLAFGVPNDWIEALRAADEEEWLTTISGHLPGEAAEALLDYAVGIYPPKVEQELMEVRDELPPADTVRCLLARPDDFDVEELRDDLTESLGDLPDLLPDLEPVDMSFEHPDAKRRFRTIQNPEELKQALDYPWDKWTIFLHPEQRALVTREQSGPARVSGSAGTGKTIVALHRAVHLAKTNPDGRVLLTTFSAPLANALGIRLRRLISNEPRIGDRIDVGPIPTVGARLYAALLGPLKVAPRATVIQLIKEALENRQDNKFSMSFLTSEWDQVVDAWQIDSWEGYRDAWRLGRKTRLREDRRKALWSIFADVRAGLAKVGLLTESGMFDRLTGAVAKSKNPLYDFAVVDEAQDVSIAQLKFLASLGGRRPNSLFFAGDPGQRIFQQPFSWKALGVDVRGRARTLRVNYRTSHQIRSQADKLLQGDITDVDGYTETPRAAISVFNGVPPVIQTFGDAEAEGKAVAQWLAGRVAEGVAAHEIGVFVRSLQQLGRARVAVEAAMLPFKVLDERVEGVSGFASLGSMHLAKGLEFRAVVVMACDDEVIPLQSRIDSVGEDSDLKEVYDTERQLLYVACTRARDFLLVTGAEPASEFLDDMRA